MITFIYIFHAIYIPKYFYIFINIFLKFKSFLCVSRNCVHKSTVTHIQSLLMFCSSLGYEVFFHISLFVIQNCFID